jgi:hypothetical protein
MRTLHWILLFLERPLGYYMIRVFDVVSVLVFHLDPADA